MAYSHIEQTSSGWMGDPRRGASMGRSQRTPETCASRFYLRRIPIDSGGYDQGGAYWGCGAPIYFAESEDGAAFLTMRAWDRDGAKEQVRETYPAARFYR